MDFYFSQTSKQKQEQRPVMAPVMMKSLQLLPMSYTALSQFLERQSLENPFLEYHSELEIHTQLYAADSLLSWQSRREKKTAEPTPVFAASDTLSSLREHLRLQLGQSPASPVVRRAGYRLIDYLDDNGYCRESSAEISRLEGLPAEDVEAALRLIKTFSPTGVGAENLEECLLLQANQTKYDPALLRRLLHTDPVLLASRNYQKIAAQCKATPQQVRSHLEHLASLNPYPGAEFSSRYVTHYIQPEITVTAENGQLHFTFHSGCDLLSIDAGLLQYIQAQDALDNDTEYYLHRKYREAVDLIQELTIRKNTVERLLHYILHLQSDYFLGGALKPVTMRAAAEALNIHPSTVSRCVSDRYIQTGAGVVPLKRMFSTGYALDTDRAVSSVEVKQKIAALIQNETRALSDQRLAELLGQEGIPISRRTVAKYREQLHIPESRIRERQYT
ncbi:MAG: RNA polymerase factor sigma-54 [Oscillospiraceae bacterium]|nr:RNA polymerase factor sigma-54 [Oscillospiraceae bacterium]